MHNQLLISLQIEEKWYTFRLFFGILSCYYLQCIFIYSILNNKHHYKFCPEVEIIVPAFWLVQSSTLSTVK